MKPVVSRRLVVAPLLVLLSALAYQATVHPAFRVVRVSLIDGDRRPTGHLVRVTLPDLSALRQSVPILTGRLANGHTRSQRARVLLGDVRRAAVHLTPGGSGDFALVLSEGTARAVTGGSGGQHVVAVAGDSDDWRLISLDVSNAYAALGRVVAVVPAQVPADAPALPAAWALLVVLGAMAMVFGAAFNTARLRRPHQVAAGVVAVALTLAVLLPLAWDRRALATPSIFWSAIGLLFAPAILAVALKGLAWAAALAAAATRLWRRHPVTCERGGVLLGLVAMAVAQPLFEVLRASPEFFVARNTSATSAVAAAATIGLVLPLSLLAVERLLRRVAPAAATIFFLTVVTVLVAVMVHPWMRRRDIADPWVMAGLAVGAGALVAVVTWRAVAMRQFLAALAPAALVVPVLFFAGADVRGSLVPSSSRMPTPPLQTTPPIVLVVFDEFPLHSLLGADDQIDAVRYPHFAALAREASWFRETTSVSSQTVWAVPAIASGRYPVAPNAVPTLRYYPQNLFTLLADRYQMDVFGRFLQLCPEDTCRRDLEGPGDGPLSLLADLGVVWLHIVLPAPLTDQLPPVVGDWMGFARAGVWRNVDGRRVRNGRRSEFDRFLGTMNASPARLYFLHSLLPHMPFEYVPSERRYDAPDYQGRDENGAGLFQRVSAAYADALHQRHLLQVGFVDSLVGRLVARLRELGIYDQALVVVTADHGASYREGVPRRAARAQNLADIVRVPLFIKRPGQRTGAVVDGIAESVDILPTIADVLGMHLPFQVDGRSLVGDGLPVRASRTFIDRSLKRAARRDVTNWRPSSEVSLARRISRFGVGSYDAVYAVPGTVDLLGRVAAELPRRAGTLRVELGSSEVRADLEASDTLPLYVRGRVLGRVAQPFAVVVNGRIVATTMSYVEKGLSVLTTMIPERALRAGRNEVSIVVVDRTGGTTTLVSTLQ
ncbi:MAG: sulfatase-like hydrolase/transferase [Vicinamibacteria bacterium]|nr:sulfatase-like hydrolase/transferase [Vicinamibacteria bacterium]